MGHEMNGGHYPWAKGSPDQYIGLYKMARDKIRAVLPDAVMCWNPLRGSNKTMWWPGDTVVDCVGVDWYNNGSGEVGGFINTPADWNAAYMKGTEDEPIGWGQWVKFCDNHGKMLCVPEWGAGHGASTAAADPSQDTPDYVDLFKTFCVTQSAAGKFMFETYFNNASHQINPQPAPFAPNFELSYFGKWSGKPHV